MRRVRVTLLMLPLALVLSAAAFAEPSTEPTPLSLQQLEEAIFRAPETQEAAWPYDGVCAYTCEPCGRRYGDDDCPKYNGHSQRCVEHCF
jgi:hypothetical protein